MKIKSGTTTRVDNSSCKEKENEKIKKIFFRSIAMTSDDENREESVENAQCENVKITIVEKSE